MICAIDSTRLERVILVGHEPTPVVFAATKGDIAGLTKKSNGHYNRDDLEALALDEASNVFMYDADMLWDILEALPWLVHGCPPRI
jgi:hypothetical protein